LTTPTTSTELTLQASEVPEQSAFLRCVGRYSVGMAGVAGHWQVNSVRAKDILDRDLGYRPTPFCKRTVPEIAVVFGSCQVPPQVKQIENSGMDT